jgi:hypothetical protein
MLTLTHTSFEDRLVANRGLSYQFRGFSYDGRFFIYGVFPVSSELLPDDETSNEFRGFKLPENPYDPRREKENRAAYARYLGMVKALIGNLASEQFKPSLDSIEMTISSLDMNQIDWNFDYGIKTTN